MHSTLERLSQQKKTYYWLYISGALLLLLSVLLWWTKVSVQPERVFWGAVNNNLASSGVTLTIESASQSVKDKQQIQFSLGKTNTVRALRTVNQNGTVVTTESIGNTKKSFTRYTDIQTSRKNTDGKTPNMSSVLGVWAESAAADQSPLLQQVALGTALPFGAMPMPIGMMQAQARNDLIEEMRKKTLYQVNYDKVKKQRKAGRLLYTYDVSMQPVLYLSIMKEFAQSLGLTDLDNLDPERYASMKAVEVQITIDAHARQLTTVASKEQKYSESFSSFGVPPQVTMPQKAISLSELQARLDALE